MHSLIRSLALFGVLALALVPSLAARTAFAADAVKVVYHVDDSIRARALLKNVENHLDADPGVVIHVVGHGKGIDFMLAGAEDPNKNPYAVDIDTLTARGVVFKVCNNTLKSRGLGPAAVAEGVKVVPSGVAEIARLQARDGFVYLKP